MRSLLRVVAFLVVGVSLGYCTADYSMQEGLAQVSARNGAWIAWPAAGRRDADPYTRAHFAASGHLPLTIFEATSFRAETDDAGDPLDLNCEYLVDGRSFRTRWWSVAAYRTDRSLIPNAAQRYSYNSENIVFESKGTFRIALARQARPGNWLPLTSSGRFYLALHLYNPQDTLRQNLRSLHLPTIRKVSCS